MLSAPFKGASLNNITQTYHPAHKALDIVSFSRPFINGYGTPLCAPEDVEIVLIRGDAYTPDDISDETNGFGVFMKGLETGFTHLFWHTQVILPVKMGDRVKRGQIVAFMGNSGEVYSSGTYVPLEERTTPPFPGTHLHWELFDENYRIGGAKRFLNPLDYVDWNIQPTYTNADHLKALAVVVGKAAGLLSKR